MLDIKANEAKKGIQLNVIHINLSVTCSSMVWYAVLFLAIVYSAFAALSLLYTVADLYNLTRSFIPFLSLSLFLSFIISSSLSLSLAVYRILQ